MPRVLVVDDDDDIRELVGVWLTRAGHAVSFATNGLEGLTEMRAYRCDVVVLDNSMPVMTGLEVLAASRDLDEHRRPWVLMLSALATRADVRRGYTAGADDFMAKPFSCVELVDRVDALAVERALFFPSVS